LLAAAEKDGALRRRVDRLLLATAAVLLIALIAVAAGGSALQSSYLQMAMAHKHAVAMGQAPFGADAAAAAWSEFSGSLLRGTFLGLLMVLLAWRTARGSVPAAMATAAALILLLVELWPVDTRIMERAITDTVPHSLDVGRDDTIEFLERAGPRGSFRILPEEVQCNRFAGFGIASLGGYHAAKPRLVQDLFDRDLQRNPFWMRLLNVRYVVLNQPLQGQLQPGVRMVHQGSSQVLELPALPRATLVSHLRVVHPAL